MSELGAALDTLGEVPGLQQITWGPDFSGRAKGYTHGAVMYFADRNALAGYLQHEKHAQVVGVLNRLLPERLVLDYETDTSGISG